MKMTRDEKGRLMTPKQLATIEATIKERKRIEKFQTFWCDKERELQETCAHPRVQYEAKGSTGGYDRNDSYWYNWNCGDCGKRWTTDQTYGLEKQYPFAEEVKG